MEKEVDVYPVQIQYICDIDDCGMQLIFTGRVNQREKFSAWENDEDIPKYFMHDCENGHSQWMDVQYPHIVWKEVVKMFNPFEDLM